MSDIKSEAGTTEKITVNFNVIDLGYIDLLVNEGYYTNRTEFIKTAVRKQLDFYSNDTARLISHKESKGSEVCVGIASFAKKDLELMLAKGERKSFIFIGVFILSNNIPLELLQNTIESIKVYGICKCSPEVKQFYSL